jgi:hypothetical protein
MSLALGVALLHHLSTVLTVLENIERSQTVTESLASQQQRLKVTAERNLTNVFIQPGNLSEAGCTVCAG